MNISHNNKAATVHRAFLAATEQFQWPIRVRTDFGGENELVWQEMLGKRGERSALVGSSVHNQPIEQLWGMINDRATLPFKVLFQTLEREGQLNTDNETDMTCLHWIFLPLIQMNLTRLCLALNKRNMSTEHQRTPCQLETQFLHLTAPFEGIPIEQHDGVDTAYQDPATLERPLQHVQCFGFDGFPQDLRRELRTLGVPHTIDQGRTLYQQAMSIVSDYILRN
jgi:hypothetical protein